MSESFGTLQLETKPAVNVAWWTDARRESFTRLCERMYWDHMRGSFGDKAVSGAVVVGYLEGPAKHKGAK